MESKYFSNNLSKQFL